MLAIMGSLIGLCWLTAAALLASAGYHRVRGSRGQAARESTRAGWVAAAAVACTLITIAAGSL